MPENLYCENCGQMLVNGVCPNCQIENFTSGAADAAPVFEAVPVYTPFYATPDGQYLQQAAEGFGFLKEKDEKIQCVYGEKYFTHYLCKRSVHRKGFVVVTEKNAYFGGKMVLTTPGAPLVKEKSVRTLPLLDISAVGVNGKYLSEEWASCRKTVMYIRIIACILAAIFCIAFNFIILGIDPYQVPYSLYHFVQIMRLAQEHGILLIAGFIIAAPFVVKAVKLYRTRGGFGKVLFNIQHNGGTIQLTARMSRATMDPITEFLQHFNQCTENVKAAEEARIAEEERLAEEARAAEEERLANEAAEEARLAEEKRLADEAAEKARLEKEAAAMQQAMEKAMQTAPASAPSSIAEELKAYSEMYKQGLINDEEFAAFKAKLLNK